MPIALDEKDRTVERSSRRSGGREARRAMRAAPLADEVRPIRPGLEGGTYRPLAEADLGRIHEAVLTLLETVGFANAIPSCVAALTGAGAVLGEDGRIRFPRRLVLDTIRRAARNFTLHGQDPHHDMLIGGRRVHYGTAGAARGRNPVTGTAAATRQASNAYGQWGGSVVQRGGQTTVTRHGTTASGSYAAGRSTS